jgi:hypothetical protein
MVLLRRTTEVPPRGRVGQAEIDLHLGQKPKLGGEVRRRFTHLHMSFCRSYVYPCFAFSIILVLISTFQNTKRPKIFCFVCYFLSVLFQKLKTQKYLLFFCGFVKFVAEFSLPLLHRSLVFTLYYSSHTSEEQ